MEREPHPHPLTPGDERGHSRHLGQAGAYIRYKGYDTELTVVDPENLVFHDAYRTGDRNLTADTSSRIEGIGRPKCPSSGILGQMAA